MPKSPSEFSRAGKNILIDIPAAPGFTRLVTGHGWCNLAPFAFDREKRRLEYAFVEPASGETVGLHVTEKEPGKLAIAAVGRIGKDRVIATVRHLLRLDEDLTPFYEIAGRHDALSWIEGSGGGRLLRSATVFEDLVKTLLTTNCSWALTQKMAANLVNILGPEAPDGRRAFPTAQHIAAVDEDFLRNVIRAGYRSPFLLELSQRVASGELDPESWLDPDISREELHRAIRGVKGIGQYAADNLFKLIGRYDGLALDSWLRAGFYRKHNRDRPCKDARIERHYKKFGDWKGLAIWCDMTEHRLREESRDQDENSPLGPENTSQ